MILLYIFLCLVAIFFVMGFYCNKNLKLTNYPLHFENLPSDFEGFTIAQISDLHNCTHKKLITKLKKSHPDIIAITGDMIDSRRTNIKIAADLAKKLTKIAPCYYVCGNHEARMPQEYNELLQKLKKAGVTTLQNEKISLVKNNQKIRLIGVEDTFIIRKNSEKNNQEIMDEVLQKMNISCDEFTILLSHRPELFSVYTHHKIDLVLTGHAHGGQIRLPVIGGLFAPNQGFLPKLFGGVHKKDRTTLVISSGIGNSQFPVRFLNPPEIPVIRLSK